MTYYAIDVNTLAVIFIAVMLLLIYALIQVLIFKWKCETFSNYFWNTYLTEILPKEKRRKDNDRS